MSASPTLVCRRRTCRGTWHPSTDTHTLDQPPFRAAANNFTALSFAGAIGKLVTLMGNASLGRILTCYGEAGGKNVPLGASAQDNQDTEAFVKHHSGDVNAVCVCVCALLIVLQYVYVMCV